MKKDILQKRLQDMEEENPSPSLEISRPTLKEKWNFIKRAYSEGVEQIPQRTPLDRFNDYMHSLESGLKSITMTTKNSHSNLAYFLYGNGYGHGQHLWTDPKTKDPTELYCKPNSPLNETGVYTTVKHAWEGENLDNPNCQSTLVFPRGSELELDIKRFDEKRIIKAIAYKIKIGQELKKKYEQRGFTHEDFWSLYPALSYAFHGESKEDIEKIFLRNYVARYSLKKDIKKDLGKIFQLRRKAIDAYRKGSNDYDWRNQK